MDRPVCLGRAFRLPRVSRRLAWLLSLASLMLFSSTAVAQLATNRVPRDDYYFNKQALYEGDYRSAMRGFASSLRSGVRIGQTRWIDSVCYYSMLGEVHFQQGNLTASLEAHEQAIRVHLQNPGWMGRLSYPRIGPSNERLQFAIGWAPRPTAMGAFPDAMSSFEGTFDTQRAFEVGGAVNPAHTRRVDAVEVFRCLAVSLRRRAEILGATSPLAPTNVAITNSFSSISVPSGHWVSAWLEVLHGLALLSDNEDKSAILHLANGTTAGAIDHPLTGIALLEHGKVRLRQGEYEAASALLLQASVAAARYEQPDIIEDAFRYLTDAFLANEGRGIVPPTAPTITFAQRMRYARLVASLQMNNAEVAVYGNSPASAAGLLSQARNILARQGMLASNIGARLAYLEAITQYRAGNRSGASNSLKLAVTAMSRTSPWQYQLGILERLHATGRKAIRPSHAEILYANLLREPSENDWRTNPLETMTMQLSKHTGAMERWFELLIDRKEYDKAVRVAERLRRHRFYSTLPFAGRVLSLRWLIEGDAAMLGKRGMKDQNRLRMKYPKLAEWSRSAKQIQLKMEQDALVAADEEQFVTQKSRIGRLRTISDAQENLVREIALRREPVRLVFPPQPNLSAIKRGMKPHQAILMFVTTDEGWHAWFIRKNMDEYWRIRNPKLVRRGVTSLLKAIGNRDKNAEVSTELLVGEAWKKPAAGLWKAMIGEFPSQGWEGLEELVVIPDGFLWYLPFELLRIPADQLEGINEDSTLISRTRVRYSPVASLSVGDQRGHRADVKTTVVGGQLYPKESSMHASEMLAKLKESQKQLEVIGKKKPFGASRFTSGSIDRLITWNDANVALGRPYAWKPAQYDRGSKESSLMDWMEYPWGGPDQVIAPGYHTAAEGNLGKKATGYEVFVTVCGLMSTGTRTALLSRWRTGGKAPAVLVGEFTKNLSEASASEAWQKAVEKVRLEKVEPATEPRVRAPKGKVAEALPADHPFFWSGYLLVDTGAEPEEELEETLLDEVAAGADANDEEPQDAAPENADQADNQLDKKDPDGLEKDAPVDGNETEATALGAAAPNAIDGSTKEAEGVDVERLEIEDPVLPE